MAESQKKIKKIIERSQNVIILPSPEFWKDIFPAALALFYSLKKLGKNVNLIAKNWPKKFKFLVKKDEVFSPPGNFLISIKEREARVSGLSYEKLEGGLNLYLQTNGELKKEDIALWPLGRGEVLITLGVERLSKVKQVLKEKPDRIINIDLQLENENYGDINLIEVSSPSFSEIVFDLLDSMNKGLLEKEVADCLLSGIVEATSNFQHPKLNSSTFQKVSYLIERGGNLNLLIPRLYGPENESSLRIFGKILSKIKILPEKNLGWVVLKKEDFLRAGGSPQDLKLSLEKLSSGIFPFQNFLVIWETKNSPVVVRGVFYSPQQSLIEKILDNFRGAQKGNGVLFQVEGASPSEIKDKIFQII